MERCLSGEEWEMDFLHANAEHKFYPMTGKRTDKIHFLKGNVDNTTESCIENLWTMYIKSTFGGCSAGIGSVVFFNFLSESFGFLQVVAFQPVTNHKSNSSKNAQTLICSVQKFVHGIC